MNIMELGAIGELVGGVAVIASLVYVGLQVRQSASVQRLTAQYAAGAAIQASADGWSVFRRMIAQESVGGVWAKARNDEELSAEEMVRLRAVVQELAYSAAATIENWRLTGSEGLARGIPAIVAVELEGSETMRRAWATMSDELRFFGFDQLAEDVSALLEQESHPS